MRSVKEIMLEFLFPPRCAICGSLLPLEKEERLLCPDCLAHPPFLTGEKCQICGRPVDNDVLCHRCRHGDFLFEAGTAAFSYETMQEEIAAFKFHGYRHEGERLSHLMAEYLLQEHPDWTTWADVLTEVPLHANKLRFRGFNQAEILCEGLAKETGMYHVPGVLERRVDTLPQSSLKAAQRKENLKNVFGVAKKEVIEGKRVLLLDDIFTTGATLQECTRTLLRAGAAAGRIYCLSVVCKEEDFEQNSIEKP